MITTGKYELKGTNQQGKKKFLKVAKPRLMQKG